MDEIIQAIIAQQMQPTQVQVDEMQPMVGSGGAAGGVRPEQGQILPGMDAMNQVLQAMEASKPEEEGGFLSKLFGGLF